MALEGLITKTGVRASQPSIMVIMGTVIQDVNTSNIAREAALAAGIPNMSRRSQRPWLVFHPTLQLRLPVEKIRSGQNKVIIAGGVETMSDIPIRFRKKFRQKLLEARKYKSFGDFLKFFKGLGPSDLLPEIPSISEYSTGETMGASCDKMAAKYGVSRGRTGSVRIRSHQLAAKATEKGLLKNELFPASPPPGL
jgi:acetyl-CoA acetyltransferase